MKDTQWEYLGDGIECNGYHIGADRVRDESLDTWLEHLKEKTWFTETNKASFLKAWAQMEERLAHEETLNTETTGTKSH